MSCLISSKESGCSLTQIAITELQAGEEVAAHMHPDMQEGFPFFSLNFKDGDLPLIDSAGT